MTIRYFQIFVITLFLSANALAQQDAAIADITATQDELVRTERMYYNEKDDTGKQLLLLHKYELDIKLGQLDEARISLSRINTAFLPTEKKQDWYTERAFLELLSANYTQSLYFAAQGLEIKSTKDINRLWQLEVLGYIMMADTGKADSLFMRWAANVTISADTIACYKSILAGITWKDPDKARRKAMILPGIGQWYAGSKRDAIINTALLLLVAGGTAFLFAHGYIFTPIISGGGLFLRFYLGGRRHAVALVN